MDSPIRLQVSGFPRAGPIWIFLPFAQPAAVHTYRSKWLMALIGIPDNLFAAFRI